VPESRYGEEGGPFKARCVNQFYSYAIHREIQAEYFILSDAIDTAIYKTKSRGSEPSLHIPISELKDRFPELRMLISKPILQMREMVENIAPELRKIDYILSKDCEFIHRLREICRIFEEELNRRYTNLNELICALSGRLEDFGEIIKGLADYKRRKECVERLEEIYDSLKEPTEAIKEFLEKFDELKDQVL
jgi:hypothetical protein